MDKNILFVICLCYIVLIFEIFYIMYLMIKYLILKKQHEHISFIRSFKKGKCAIIFLTTIPLYWIGNFYAGKDLLSSFFYSISRVGKLVVLEFDTSSISSLMESNSLYRFIIYFNFILVLINALCFVLSIIHQRIWCWWQNLLIKKSNKDKLFIFGNNSENISIYESEKNRLKTLIDNLSNKDKEDFYTKGISFISTNDFEHIINKYLNFEKQKKEIIVIINTKKDEENIKICKYFINKINNLTEAVKKRLFLKTKIYVFGDTKYEALYREITSNSSSCIHYINKYHKIAIDFIDNYPFARFMNANQIDYQTSLVKDDININALFIGFGKTNQEIFLTSVANNQFITYGDTEPRLKQVNYYLFDKNETEKNKNLNHSYYRYKNWKKGVNKNDYLELPDDPALEIPCHLDINDFNFYNQIREIISRNKNDANFIIIAFGSDLENLDMAHKLVEKRKEWEIDNLIIFVKVRDALEREDLRALLLNDEKCFFIGNEQDVVFNIEKITNNLIYNMALIRNEIYRLESRLTENSYTISDKILKEIKEEAYDKWNHYPQIKRQSNFYCCLSLRSKLNLMGLDYCKIDNPTYEEISEQEYLEIYAGNDKPEIEYKIEERNGKNIIKYTIDFPQSRRRNMALHEHLRWNSYYITEGFIPASKEQIETERISNSPTDGTNEEVRRHGCLTTFEGLKEYRKILARDGKTEEEIDKIKYDYQLLDDAYWLLNSNGYKIVRLIPNK